ncbi:MAG: lysophospholipid acyltransferase family protein [Methylacidiphilaceae bacterium]|nr:lysophospholipid acyltransferase family protein [Candidatus Methylacidiphilaceae bacterium]
MVDAFAARGSAVSRPLYRSRWFALGVLAARFLPRRVVRGIGAGAALAFAFLRPKHAAVVARNLRRILARPVREADSRRVYGNFGKAIGDYFYLGSRSAACARGLVEERIGYEGLASAHRRGKGALLLTGHLGLFELGGALLSGFGFPTVILTFPEPDQDLSRWRSTYRRRWGVETLEIGEDAFSFLAVRKELSQGKFVAALVDRPSPTSRVSVRLPHGRLPVSTGILYLAMLEEVPVFVVTVTEKANRRYRVWCSPPLLFSDRGSEENALEAASQQVFALLVPEIQAHWSQWYQFVPLEGAGTPDEGM